MIKLGKYRLKYMQSNNYEIHKNKGFFFLRDKVNIK